MNLVLTTLGTILILSFTNELTPLDTNPVFQCLGRDWANIIKHLNFRISSQHVERINTPKCFGLVVSECLEWTITLPTWRKSLINLLDYFLKFTNTYHIFYILYTFPSLTNTWFMAAKSGAISFLKKAFKIFLKKNYMEKK